MNPSGRNRRAITVAGTLGSSPSIAAIASANPSTCDPAGRRTYFGGSADPSSRATVFRLIDNFAATAAWLMPSTRCNRCTSAQSCTEYIPLSPRRDQQVTSRISRNKITSVEEVLSFRPSQDAQSSTVVDKRWRG